MYIFRKTILFALATALAVASIPVVGVSAAGQNDLSTTDSQISNERLEKTWARQQRIYTRLGRTEELIEKTQKLIDRAKANDKDVLAVQTALDAFAAAAKEAHPIYESMKGIVKSHQGFDVNGKVTDPAKAQETVRAMREKFREIKTTMNDSGKSLHEAIKAFREANPHPEASPTGG